MTEKSVETSLRSNSYEKTLNYSTILLKVRHQFNQVSAPSHT